MAQKTNNDMVDDESFGDRNIVVVDDDKNFEIYLE